jgi:hypothetical protein
MHDNKGDAFTCVSGSLISDATQLQASQICYSQNVTGGSTTVSSTFPNTTFQSLSIAEFSGVAKTNAQDVAASRDSTGNTNTDGIVSNSSTTTASDLVLGGVINITGGSITITKGTNQTEVTNRKDGSISYETEYYVQSSSGTASSTWTFGQTQSYLASMATFKPSASNTTTTTQLNLSSATLNVGAGTLNLN